MVLTSIAETRWCEVNHTDIVAIYFGDIDYTHLEDFRRITKFAILSFKNNGSLSRELQSLFPRNLINDPQHTLDGMLVLKCFFCNAFQTPIEYDMKVHLRYTHRKELVTHLSL
jgi:hypothetical protein